MLVDWDPSSTEGGSSPLICPDLVQDQGLNPSMENAKKWLVPHVHVFELGQEQSDALSKS